MTLKHIIANTNKALLAFVLLTGTASASLVTEDVTVSITDTSDSLTSLLNIGQEIEFSLTYDTAAISENVFNTGADEIAFTSDDEITDTFLLADSSDFLNALSDVTLDLDTIIPSLAGVLGVTADTFLNGDFEYAAVRGEIFDGTVFYQAFFNQISIDFETDASGNGEGNLFVVDTDNFFSFDVSVVNSAVDVPAPYSLAIFALGVFGLASRRLTKSV